MLHHSLDSPKLKDWLLQYSQLCHGLARLTKRHDTIHSAQSGAAVAGAVTVLCYDFLMLTVLPITCPAARFPGFRGPDARLRQTGPALAGLAHLTVV